jgi:radical SAM superfamily enzyme YgiQ (UPF0313 family)
VRVDIIDDYDLDNPDIFEPYDYIGISIMTPQRKEAKKLLDTIKQRWPEKIVIGGGPHVLHYIDDIVDDAWDFLVRGDGERLLPKIITSDGEGVERVSYDFIPRATLAGLPKPDRVGEQEFLSKYKYRLRDLNATTMLTGRGCPMNCKFCEDARTTTRWTSIENTKAELDDIVAMGYKGVYLFDDLFAINLRKCEPYLDLLKKSGLKFRCNVHAKFMTDEFAKALAEAGCIEVAFGAESGSQEMLDRMDKKTTVQQNYDCVKYCKKYGITVKAFLMIGLPGETLETVAETEKFILNSGIDDAQVAIYYPYKGTQFRDEMDTGKASDLLFEGEGLGAYGTNEANNEAVVRTEALTSQQLIKIREELIQKYKFRTHTSRHKEDDEFFQTHLEDNPDYSAGGDIGCQT